ncbi:Lrp/AsnC family transcriptional regulator [Actinocrispum wychmicini]|uniref:Lrp/AsnC family transcriptional regulator n=1 Tax=Actinocrispum wychmicini TaxID=1213861 RepID=UPI001FB5D38B|nr:Lrp/AsnC family transcriptional regulator [Actinocrispum wychmicini]
MAHAETETVILDDVDRGLVHALRIDGRAPFRHVGEVIGVSENTVARRYRRLRTAGVLRVVGALNGGRLGYSAWTIRVRCAPDAALPIAKSLAARADTSYVHLLSGGTEISCGAQIPTRDESDALLLRALPRTARVTSVTAHLLLGSYVLPNDWTGAAVLSAEQVAALSPPPVAETDDIELSAADRPLLTLLSQDGRASHAQLAAATGWSEATVRRRLFLLRQAGVLAFFVDIPPAALGFHTEARLWMSVRPSGLTAVAAAIAEHPEVSLVSLTTGPSNLLAAVNCRDAGHLSRYLTERVGMLDAIRAIETAPVIRTLKRAGALLPAIPA